MITAHPKRAWSKLLILLFVTCLTLPSIAVAAAASSHRSFPRASASTVSHTLDAAATASRAADHALVSDAKALKACQLKHPTRCKAQRSAVQRAGRRLAISQRRLAELAQGSTSRFANKSAATSAPTLTVSGQTLSWTRPGNVNTFVFVRKVPGQGDQYSVINGASITPPSVPGYTVRYSVRTNVSGSAWAEEQSISYPAPSSPGSPPIATLPVTNPPITESPVTTPPITESPVTAPPITTPPVTTPPVTTPPVAESPVTTPPTTPVNLQTAPIIAVSGQTLTWTKIGNVNTYVFVRKVPGQEDQYSVLSGTSTTPPAVPGATVRYSIRTAVEGSAWAPEAAITYPALTPPTTPPSPPVDTQEPPVSEPPAGEPPASEPSPPVEEPAAPPTTGKIIGTNDGVGWGPAAAHTILAGHITWNRVEIGASTNTLAASLSDGFHVLAIVGNTSDTTPLSQIEPSSWAATVVSQLKANPGITIAEAGNETFLKGAIANPIQYGRMYLAAVNAKNAAGIHTPLLFDMFGDYPVGSWSSPTSWSRDSTGGGWLRDAVNNVPGLATAILANGLGSHPYGALGENSKDSYGTAAVAGQEAIAKTVLGSTPTVYITEFGYDLGRCGEIDGACSQTEQATKMRAAYKVFLADPHVAGIFAYQSHDDGTGQWGYMNNDNTTRPTYNVLTEIATEQGQ
jgi:hypothetical protein